jgi:hypothetical protein
MSNVISGEDPATGDTGRITFISWVDSNGKLHRAMEVSATLNLTGVTLEIDETLLAKDLTLQQIKTALGTTLKTQEQNPINGFALDNTLTDGTQQTQISYSPCVAYYSGSSTVTETVNGKSIAISNDGATDLTVTVNGITSTIQAGEMIGPAILNFGPFTSIIVTTTSAYRMWVYE